MRLFGRGQGQSQSYVRGWGAGLCAGSVGCKCLCDVGSVLVLCWECACVMLGVCWCDVGSVLV